ncbi:hypothetical protein C9374_005681 [Naegleria lovaniensis]|uniref:VWFA domain-containing protein n=1 Tax=Naegleria lovaniensis TaxID=51637 RepID=A0AA88KHK7_NAELO|nr:uncharacterized protein C9374_005681 [Naegleria lovaniensis]KAG2381889.1 hypothetical protein C9374_005681 [Naegleria lovaniensis]
MFNRNQSFYSNMYPSTSSSPSAPNMAYEVPSSMQNRHEEQFYQHSYQLEDALQGLQLVLLVDKSGSMNIADEDATGQGRSNGMIAPNVWTRYDNVFQVAKYLAESVFQYDANGSVPIIFFDEFVKEEEATNIGQMLVKFRNNKPQTGTTNMLDALKLAFDRHLNNRENILFIVFTDGCPDAGQEPKILDLIHKRVVKSDPTGNRVNILFIRHGDDPQAIQFLKHLDDCDLIGKNVDTKSDNAVFAMGPKNVILNAIFEHMDDQFAHFV